MLTSEEAKEKNKQRPVRPGVELNDNFSYSKAEVAKIYSISASCLRQRILRNRKLVEELIEIGCDPLPPAPDYPLSESYEEDSSRTWYQNKIFTPAEIKLLKKYL